MAPTPFSVVAGGPLVGNVTNVLTQIDLDPSVIEQIVSLLEDAQQTIAEAKPPGVNPAAFGSSWRGGNLGYHTDLAHQKFLEAFVRMLDELTSTEEGLVDHYKDVYATDDYAYEAMSKLRTRLV